MPPVRSVSFSDNLITIQDFRGITRTLTAAVIPSQQNTPALVETWINTVWVPANIAGYQLRVHVFSLAPLRVTVCTANLGVAIPGDWWQSG